MSDKSNIFFPLEVYCEGSRGLELMSKATRNDSERKRSKIPLFFVILFFFLPFFCCLAGFCFFTDFFSFPFHSIFFQFLYVTSFLVFDFALFYICMCVSSASHFLFIPSQTLFSFSQTPVWTNFDSNESFKQLIGSVMT